MLCASVGDYDMAITCDTGAQVSIVPVECVRSDQLTGKVQKVKYFHGFLIEDQVCRVTFKIGETSFERDAVAVSGDLINWTPCYQVPYKPRHDVIYILDKMEEKFQKEEYEQLYLPPMMNNGILETGGK